MNNNVVYIFTILEAIQKNINWQSVASFRNEIVHNYRGIDKQIVWNIISTKLVPLKEACIALLRAVNPDKHMILKYISSEYFKHLSYLESEL